MKLARPDVFHPRIVLAGDPLTPSETTGRADDAGLIAALRGRGLAAGSLAWNDPQTLDADLVILRAAHREITGSAEFARWTRRVRNLLNAPDVLAWNLDARYLADLRYAGVPTATHPDPAAQTALIFFAGGRSHAFGAGGPDPDFELWELGRSALRAAAERLSIRIDELLYARADVVGPPGAAVLAGLDLVAPQFGWRDCDDALREAGQRRFALAVESALDRLDLGPLSHRRP